MSSKIRVLSDQTINQIAAGEVIENPASVVKELVENSIDAGSTEIMVEINAGGRQLIRITDNGCGMGRDDALLCLERHATSKIRASEDIHEIFTMGFRGEAIPSIASISKFMLLTCPQGAPSTEATIVVVDGGKMVQCASAVRSPGTTIEVKSLFFNVPVRQKFQKSPTFDQNEILKMLTTIALGNPSVKFQLISNGTTLLHTAAGELKERIDSVLGTEFAYSCFPIEFKEKNFTLKGMIGQPACTRQNRTGQFLFINKRPVQSPLINFAIKQGYGTTLPTGRHPIYVLHFEMPAEWVDINVHPQKKEVRFRHEADLRAFVIKAVEQGLQATGGGNMPTEEIEPAFTFSTVPFVSEEMVITTKPAYTYQPLIRERVIAEEPVLFRTEPAAPAKATPKIIGTIPNYIIADSLSLSGAFDHLCLIDQRAAHARILYEKLNTEQTPASQLLLLPHTLAVTPIEAAVVRDNLTILEKMGFQLHESGPNLFLVEAVPQFLMGANLDEALGEILLSFEAMPGGEWLEQERLKQLTSAIGKAVMPANKHLRTDEAFALIVQLLQCKSPTFCPKGKPTILHLSQEDLQKLWTTKAV